MGIDTVYEQDMQTAHIIQPAEEMAAIIQQFDNIVIVAHGSPDGDAIGATGAMGSLVKALGKRFVLYNATGIPDYLEWVPLPGKLVTKPSAIPFKPGLIVLDCGDAWRMGKELLAVFPEYPSVNIDHHLGNPMFASLGNWVDPGMAATGQMVAAVADAAGVPLTGELAQCVYLSLVSDTGSFTHGNTSAAVFTLAARLVANGLDAAAMREKLDNQWSMPKTKLWGKLMQTLSLECDGTVAVCPVTMEEIGSFGAVREDLEGFAEQMRRIKGVRVAVLIRQVYRNIVPVLVQHTLDHAFTLRLLGCLVAAEAVRKNVVGDALAEPARRVVIAVVYGQLVLIADRLEQLRLTAVAACTVVQTIRQLHRKIIPVQTGMRRRIGYRIPIM